MSHAELAVPRQAAPVRLDRRAARLAPALCCFLLGLLGAVAMAVLTPPFQVPDEQQHFYRAFQVSELRLWSGVQDGVAGAMLPSSLPELADAFLGSRQLHIDRPIRAQRLRETWSALDRPLAPERREFVDFTGAAFYSPLPYLPQAIGIAVGRWIGTGPLGLLYLGRLANALAAVTVLALAVWLMPVGREVAMLLGLLPMAVFEYGSVSPDAAVIATAFLFTAIMLRGQSRGRWTPGEIAAAAASGLVFCSLKPVYMPLLLLGLPAALGRGRARHTLLVHAAILAVTLGGTVAWLRSSLSVLILPVPGTSISDQAAHIAGAPIGYAAVILRSFWYNAAFYYKSTVGMLGWLSLPLPGYAYALPVAGVLFGTIAQPADTPRLPAIAIAWHLALLAGSVILVMTALYLYYTTVGYALVVGVQGRYFLPLSALAGATLCSVVRLQPRWEGSSVSLLAVVGVAAIGLLTAAVVSVRAYELF